MTALAKLTATLNCNNCEQLIIPMEGRSWMAPTISIDAWRLQVKFNTSRPINTLVEEVVELDHFECHVSRVNSNLNFSRHKYFYKISIIRLSKFITNSCFGDLYIFD